MAARGILSVVRPTPGFRDGLAGPLECQNRKHSLSRHEALGGDWGLSLAAGREGVALPLSLWARGDLWSRLLSGASSLNFAALMSCARWHNQRRYLYIQ